MKLIRIHAELHAEIHDVKLTFCDQCTDTMEDNYAIRSVVILIILIY